VKLATAGVILAAVMGIIVRHSESLKHLIIEGRCWCRSGYSSRVIGDRICYSEGSDLRFSIAKSQAIAKLKTVIKYKM
jgi:hypothetical protein